MNIVSLLPGLTELVCCLGLEDHLTGRSHECDYPESVTDLPILTSANYSQSTDSRSRDIHESVTDLLRQALSIFDVDEQLLRQLRPDIILTQDQCKVCAVSYGELKNAVKDTLGSSTQILSVSPASLQEIYRSFQEVADILGVPTKGEELVRRIRQGFDEIRDKTDGLEKPSVVALEWMDPLMTGGNWMPEMIEIAGGVPHLAEAGKHSPWCKWEMVVSCDPYILLIMPCGYGISQTVREMNVLADRDHWSELTAVRQNNVYILDGNHYFNRPGPRIKESVQILAEIFHPDEFGRQSGSDSWIRFQGEKTITNFKQQI